MNHRRRTENIVARHWPDGVVCPRCGDKDVLFLAKYNCWRCREKGEKKHSAPQFTLKTGTIMEEPPIGLDKMASSDLVVVQQSQ